MKTVGGTNQECAVAANTCGAKGSTKQNDLMLVKRVKENKTEFCT